MMHYGFCRKHADQMGEGGCPECAMDHQQATISAMTETAKESSRVHIEMHNQITAIQAEVARLTLERDQWKGVFDRSQDDEAALRTRIAELEAIIERTNKHEAHRLEVERRDATEAALWWAWGTNYDTHDCDGMVKRGLAAPLGEGR